MCSDPPPRGSSRQSSAPLTGRRRPRDDDALGRPGRYDLSHLETAILQKVVELLACPLHRRVLHHHIEIRELAFWHLIRWTDNTLDYDKSCRGRHRTTAGPQNVDGCSVVPVVQNY